MHLYFPEKMGSGHKKLDAWCPFTNFHYVMVALFVEIFYIIKSTSLLVHSYVVCDTSNKGGL